MIADLQDINTTKQIINSASRSFLGHPTNDLHSVFYTLVSGFIGTAEIMHFKKLLYWYVNTANRDQLIEKCINKKDLRVAFYQSFLSNFYFRIDSNKKNTFLEIRKVAGAFFSGLLGLTAQRQIPDYEQTGTSELEQAKHFYVTNLLIP